MIIFDVQTCPALMTQGGLKQLLESEHITKVRHCSVRLSMLLRIPTDSYGCSAECSAVRGSILRPQCSSAPVLQCWPSCAVTPLQVVHDCRNDSAALFFQCEVQIKNVFDTQVRTRGLAASDGWTTKTSIEMTNKKVHIFHVVPQAAHAVLQLQDTGKPVYKVSIVSSFFSLSSPSFSSYKPV